MAPKQKPEIADPIQSELDSIKRLLTLFLLKAGATQEEVAMALSIDQSAVSRMFPARKLKKFETIKS
jgi:predicted transcriptional regulator